MAAVAVICAFNQNVYCKFKENCRQLHINELCTRDNCVRNECQYRHPRPCRYFQAAGSCKFQDHCSYLHEGSLSADIASLRQEISTVSANINHIARTLEDLEKALSTSLTEESNNFTNRTVLDTVPQLDGIVEENSTPDSFEFICNTCHEGFNEPDDFMIHDSFPYRCEECGVCFPVRFAFDLHVRRSKT